MKFLNSKRNYLISILAILSVLVLAVIWSSHYYIVYQHKQFKQDKTEMLTQTAKTIYQKQQSALTLAQPLIDDNLRQLMYNISDAIKTQSAKAKIDQEYLIKLTHDNPVTGIWLLDQNGIVKVSSDGTVDTSHTDPNEIGRQLNMVSKLQWLLDNEDSEWIDQFRKSPDEPYVYYKSGFYSLGYIEGVGRVVLEVKVTLDDIIEYDSIRLKEVVVESSQISDNLVDLEIKSADKFSNTSIVEEGKNLISTVKVKDLTGETVVLEIECTYPEIDQQSQLSLWISLGVTITYLLAVVFILRLVRSRSM
ncbi:hypothetical protein HSE3_gp099 [Bacillus phage vB_BceM-HSE3]|nr:hypothetical protein HSE3_gp099 [Bacillus phage vB_BceM-HSE3]